MNEKIAFFSVIYPMKQDYLLDFFSSLDAQTYNSFDLVIVNDGVQGVDRIIERFSNLNVIILKAAETPLENRRIGIEFLLDNGYDIAIFGDADDYFSSNRVKVSVEKLAYYDVVVNDLVVFGEHFQRPKTYLSQRLNNNSEVSLAFVRQKNIFGMSNTAFKTRSVGNVIYDQDLKAFDWYFFSLILMRCRVGVFTNECKTFYRQHANNLVGIINTSDRAVLTTLEVKEKHYELLSIEDKSFVALLDKVRHLKASILCGKSLVDGCNSELDFPFWWENMEIEEPRA